jgi:hypothetical protein
MANLTPEGVRDKAAAAVPGIVAMLTGRAMAAAS